MFCRFAAIVMLVASLAAAGAPNLKDPKGTLSLVGVWKVESVVDDGMHSEPRGLSYEFTADGRIIATQDGELEKQTKYAIDSKRQPAEISIILKGTKETVTSRGIWKIDGGKLTWCWKNLGEPGCPTEFAAPEGSGCCLWTFTPVKK